jgi:hypothetical protein
MPQTNKTILLQPASIINPFKISGAIAKYAAKR